MCECILGSTLIKKCKILSDNIHVERAMAFLQTHFHREKHQHEGLYPILTDPVPLNWWMDWICSFRKSQSTAAWKNDYVNCQCIHCKFPGVPDTYTFTHHYRSRHCCPHSFSHTSPKEHVYYRCFQKDGLDPEFGTSWVCTPREETRGSSCLTNFVKK